MKSNKNKIKIIIFHLNTFFTVQCVSKPSSTSHLYQTTKEQQVSKWVQVWVSEVSFHSDVLCTHNLTTL